MALFVQVLKGNLKYLQNLYKSQGFAGQGNYILRLIDGFFLPVRPLAQPVKAKIKPIEGICNLKSRMCSTPISTEKKEMNFDGFKVILDKLKYCVELKLFSGGETLLVKDLLKMIAYAKRKGIFVFLLTNGLLLDEKMAKELVKLRLDAITFSLHAATPQLYAYIAAGGNFEQVIRNIGTLVRLKEESNYSYPFISLAFTAMKRNIHELPSFISLASELGVNRVVVLPLVVNGTELGVEEESLFNHSLLAEKYIIETER